MSYCFLMFSMLGFNNVMLMVVGVCFGYCGMLLYLVGINVGVVL